MTPKLHASTPRTLALSLLTATLISSTAFAQDWFAEGPGPNTNGQVEGIADGEVIGAINSVATHPTDANVIYAGAGNGGIWKTTNALNDPPTWVNQTDDFPSLSIGAVDFDPTDATAQTLIAGIGRFSSIGRRGGERRGLLYTTNGGADWAVIDGGGALIGCNIKGVAAQGTTFVISVDGNDGTATLCGSLGVFRSTDSGATWGGGPVVAGTASELTFDPSNNDLYAVTIGGSAGVHRSTNGGASWTPIGDGAVNGSLGSAINAELSVFNNAIALISYVGSGVSNVFHSSNNGTNWTQLDNPQVGPNTLHPGGQGSIHLSIAIDRNNTNIIYAGGDRQNFPNSVGANDFSGNLMRADVSQAPGSQWVHLTHDSNLGPVGGGTATDSAPHADSRDLEMLADGTLIEGDDGGIYRRTSPQDDTGDWFTINGNLQSTEFHGTSYDVVSGIILGGTQDTGTPEQINTMDVRWRSVSTADGGDTAAAPISTPGMSIRFSSNQFLGGFRRRIVDSNNVVQQTQGVSAGPIAAQFYTPIRSNAVNGDRLIVGGSNGVFESTNRGDTFTSISGVVINSVGEHPIAYGTAGNEDALYVGSGTSVFIRTAAPPASVDESVNYPGAATVVDIAMNPADFTDAFVADTSRVFRTQNAGTSWTEVTGNLGSFGAGTISAMVYANTSRGDIIIVGTLRGAYAARSQENFMVWRELGNLPNAPIYDLDYNAAEDIVVAGMLGRGAWSLLDPALVLLPEDIFDDSFEDIPPPP